MAIPLAPPPNKVLPPEEQKLADWLYQLWQVVTGVVLATTAISYTAGPPATTTITGNLVVTGTETDSQTYTKLLGVYSGLLAE
jgi:hypothetical protein